MKTHCKHGHSLEDAYISSAGWRMCRTCREGRRHSHNERRRKGTPRPEQVKPKAAPAERVTALLDEALGEARRLIGIQQVTPPVIDLHADGLLDEAAYEHERQSMLQEE